MVFSAAISCKAKAYIRERIREEFNARDTQVSLERTAAKLNSKIRGWLNYYSRFGRKEAGRVFVYLNVLIRRWVEEKYRLRSRRAVMVKYEQVMRLNPGLFVHWRNGIIK